MKTDREFGLWSLFLLFATVFALTTLPTGSALSQAVATAFLLGAVVQWFRDWHKRARASEELWTSPAGPQGVVTTYEPPYDTWESRGTREHHSVFSPELNRRLQREEFIEVQQDSPWFPSDEAGRLRVLWGGRPGILNEKKIRLNNDLLPNSRSVSLSRTDYNSYVVTNNLAQEEVHSKTGRPLSFRFVGPTNGKVTRLDRSECANNIGGDLLVVSPGRVWLQLQSAANYLFPRK